MNVEARSLIVDNIFKKGEFIIPDYQREYDWSSDNVNEFIDDIENNENNNYFIGHMVCEGSFNGNIFKVIDGQQRITTITIMLCVLRDIFYTKGLKNLSLGLNKYIFDTDKDNSEFAILNNEMPYPVLQKYIQSTVNDKDKDIDPKKSSEKKMISIYDKFYKRWSELFEEELKLIRDKILNLEIIFVAVDNEVDATNIFQTLNAKGKDLTPLDLIKNQVFKHYKRQSHLNEPNDSWKKIIQNINDTNSKFLSYYWASKYKKTSDRTIYKEFVKESANDTFCYNRFTKDLLYNSKLYKKLISPDKEIIQKEYSFKVYLFIQAMITFKVKVANSIILSLMREYKNAQVSLTYLEKMLAFIERFHFINNAIVGARSSGLDTIYSNTSVELYKAKTKVNKHEVIDNLIKLLSNKLASKEEFEMKLNDRLYYTSEKTESKKLVQYVLRKLEYKRQNYNVELYEMSLEHIYPENPSMDWNTIDKEYVKDIANLVLIDKDINSEIGNKSYIKKKEIILKKSTIVTTKEVFEEYDKWEDSDIVNRKSTLIKELYEF